MLANLLSSINTNVTEFLDRLIFINSDVTLNLINVLGKNSYSGINLICNSLIYGFLLYYAFSYLLSHLTFAQIESPHQFIFTLLFCVFALNARLVFFSGLIFIFSYVSNMIRELGNYLLGVDVSFTGLISNVIPKDYFISNSFSLFNFDGILKASISFGFLSLTISYSIRYILIKTLVILAPFAILSLCSSKTNWFFKSWFKSLLSMLFLQIFVAIILLVCFIVENNGVASLPSQIIHLGMIYTLFKANSFVKEFIGGFGTDVSLNASSLSSFFRGGDLK